MKQSTQLKGSEKIARNQPCLCGSGKKYKKCCLIKSMIVAQATEHIHNEECLHDPVPEPNPPATSV